MKNLRVAGCVAAALMCFGSVGCANEQQEASALILNAGNVVAAIETQQGKVDIAKKIQDDAQAASAAVANFKAGTASQDVSYVLNVFAGDLNLIAVPADYQPVVDLAIAGVEQLLAGFPASTTTAPTVTPAVYRQSMAQFLRVNDKPLPQPKMKMDKKTVKDFKKQWDQLMAKHPELKIPKAK